MKRQVWAGAIPPIEEVRSPLGQRGVDLGDRGRRLRGERLGQEQVVCYSTKGPSIRKNLDLAPGRLALERMYIDTANAKGALAGDVEKIPPGQRIFGRPAHS